ncbi:MAG: 16S rRNA (cytosine(1402)-N(4))-methyltransferase RsmH [Firmicutes bacterium]|nr:16S rRNA (cytosine(1402)-N(4))-methyltransferase RsmH [Bacillota bacterium]
MEKPYHIPVLLKETIDALKVKTDGIYLDGTAGGGGHSHDILARGGKVICIDRDKNALNYIENRFSKFAAFKNRYMLIHNNFKNALEVLKQLDIPCIDGAVLDLGISSEQIDNRERGFSYLGDAKLDMRMDETQSLSAKTVVNEYDEKELVKIFFDYGEEKLARKIARRIVEKRSQGSIEFTGQLVKIIEECYPRFFQGGHPAKRVFQSLRIEVNDELDGLENALKNLISVLKPKARLAVISFHSLEDKIAKQTFRTLASGCVCPKSLPLCVCRHTPTISLVNPKGIRASENELQQNSRAKSATLRAIEKLE